MTTILLALAALKCSAWAADPVGKIDSVYSPDKKFSVTVHRGSKDLQLDAGKPLEEEDLVRAGDDQGVSLELGGESVVALGAGAELVVSGPTSVELKSGSAFV